VSDTIYGKGITVASGFDLGAKTPLDSRIVASTIEERDSHVSNNRAYDGMVVYVIEDKTTYQYLNGEWVIFGAEVIDNLASDSTIKGLSANQGRVLNEKIADINTNINQNINESLVEVNKKIEEVGSEVDTLAGNIADELETIHGQLESVKDGIDYNDLLNKPTIPTRVTQLTNDANYATKEYVDSKVEQGGNNNEGAGVYIGTTAPENTNLIWIDATTPYNLNPNSYEERLRLNYISTVNKTYFKLLAIQSNISKLEDKINEISIDHSSEAGACRAELARQRSRLSVLENQIISTLALLNSETELTSLKARCKQIRADMKSIRYSLADLAHETMKILDQEKGIIIPDDEGGESGGDDDVVTDEYALLTETGLNILTEDGLIIIADVLSTPSNALLTETGVTILTEDGLIILLDGVTTEEAVKDAILNELGVAILTEDGRILLKG
jgi:peptidoglycan hydrolase CwlO-like protein